MKKVRIFKQEIKETASVEINGNIVEFEYAYEMGNAPKKVAYSVFRETNPAMQVMGGSLEENGNFPRYNIMERQKGDGVLEDEIYDICKAIVDGKIKKEMEPNKAIKEKADVKK